MKSEKYGNLEVIFRKLSEIEELPNNPRTITDKQFDILVQSIKDNPEFFYARPILLSNRTGELVAFAGNKRLSAAYKAKLRQVPTILFEGLSEEKERELAIRDNIQNGEWDKESLIEHWGDVPLIDLGFELELAIDNPLTSDAPEMSIRNPADYSVTVYFKSNDEQQQFIEKMNEEGYHYK